MVCAPNPPSCAGVVPTATLTCPAGARSTAVVNQGMGDMGDVAALTRIFFARGSGSGDAACTLCVGVPGPPPAFSEMDAADLVAFSGEGSRASSCGAGTGDTP